MIRILTLNIHKGFTHFNARFMLHELRDAIRLVNPDIVFLQEVQGAHSEKAALHHDWPTLAQYEFLADEVWSDYAYGQNAAYTEGHHGNAILSKYPIDAWEQVDISTNPIEQRGHLYCRLTIPGKDYPIHCVCIHLGLSALARRKQLRMISDYVERVVPSSEPLIIAGDTNDWTGVPTKQFVTRVGLDEVSRLANGRHAKTFPARQPLLSLDRIYARGMTATSPTVHNDAIWRKLSDHVPLSVELTVGVESASNAVRKSSRGSA